MTDKYPSTISSAKYKVVNGVIKTIMKVTQPHISKLLMSNKPQGIDWRNDPRPRPPRKVFDKTAACNKDNYLIGDSLSKRDFNSRPFRILSLDGGGVRGMLTISMLQRIAEHRPTFMDEVDMIAGTSAGGILALLVASGYTPKECTEIYSFSAPHIFAYNPWRAINPFRSKYSDKAKQELMEYYFGERTMMDLEKMCAIVAFRLDGRKSKTHSFFDREGWRPAVFSNMPKNNGLVEPDKELLAWDASMRTSAAPTYFPVVKGYTDGGLVANNPSIIALSKAMAHHSNISNRNIVCLSLGSGSFPRHVSIFDQVSRSDSKYKNSKGETTLGRADWGIKQWIPFLLDILIDGDSVTTELLMNYLLGQSNLYHRLDPELPRQMSLDDVSNMDELRAFANNLDMKETFDFVDKTFGYESYDASRGDFNNSLESATNYHDAWKVAANSNSTAASVASKL